MRVAVHLPPIIKRETVVPRPVPAEAESPQGCPRPRLADIPGATLKTVESAAQRGRCATDWPAACCWGWIVAIR